MSKEIIEKAQNEIKLFKKYTRRLKINIYAMYKKIKQIKDILSGNYFHSFKEKYNLIETGLKLTYKLSDPKYSGLINNQDISDKIKELMLYLTNEMHLLLKTKYNKEIGNK